MMFVFLLVAALLTVGATLLLVWPLLRQRSSSILQEEDKRLSVYRQQLAELKQDLADRVVTDEQFDQSRRELERRMLEETALSGTDRISSRWNVSARAVALTLMMVIPLAGFLLYWKWGNPLALTHPMASSTESKDISGYDHQTPDGLETLADRLKQRMERNPDDGAGWALLARSYVELGRHADAVAAFEKAASLVRGDAQLLVDYADAFAMAQGRKLEGKPDELVKQALKLDPRNVKGQMLAGTIAYERKEFSSALAHWEKAKQGLPPEVDAEVGNELTANINEVRGLLGLAPQSPPGTVRESPPAVAASNRGIAITGQVALAPDVAGKGAPSDTLFVFARSIEGPPMPVAIVRATKQDLPFTFRLDDSNSPMPARRLSEAGPVVIVARLSRSGEATPKSGDLQGMSQPIKPGAQNVRVTIDSVLP